MRLTNWALSLLLAGMLSGCTAGGGEIAHQRSIAELNQKAQQMMNAGDIDGAIGRLESAHDLEPENVRTSYNLATAYQMKGDHAKAVDVFKTLVDKPGLEASDIYRGMGISHEAEGDAALAKGQELKDQAKPDMAAAQLKVEEAMGHYQAAIESYQKAQKGAKKPKELQAQAEALQQRLTEPGKLLR